MSGSNSDMSNADLSNRVDRLETTVGGVVTQMENLTQQFGRLVDGLSKIEPTAQREAKSVKDEMREEKDRTSRMYKDLLTMSVTLLGAVSLVVGAFCGPYLNKVNSTGQSVDDLLRRVGEIREVGAQQGAAIGKNTNSIDNIRERLVRDEAKIEEQQRAQAYQAGWMNSKLGYGGPY